MKRKNENWKDAGVILLLVVVVTIVFITFVTIDNLEKTNEIKELQEENKILKNKIDEIFIKMEDVGYQNCVKNERGKIKMVKIDKNLILTEDEDIDNHSQDDSVYLHRGKSQERPCKSALSPDINLEVKWDL